MANVTHPTAGRRRENVPGGRHKRHVVKVSPLEGDWLESLASERGITVARLLVESARAHHLVRFLDRANGQQDPLTSIAQVKLLLTALSTSSDAASCPPGQINALEAEFLKLAIEGADMADKLAHLYIGSRAALSREVAPAAHLPTRTLEVKERHEARNGIESNA